ncbi:uncharacterized protein K489DRAFT_88942 [Dissoconium aciculare CBS 342.82]|uniref:Integral membrane protein n=1 Tax=Dissoconium aciculare CBS 342.82 TaxID=1314786 RepID=A0A6J3LSD3_9PEZI|nr:uncharacterized protein K489DRAFT_88942 [Dissoconium aciculare CBS 342.82]KAF1818710.1 hypothetical protein K489DRAFT_88942 [Dissoconium aciculare CBS 342.82]
MEPDTIAAPPLWRWSLGFLAVGICWGFTTPFMRRAAVKRDQRPKSDRPETSDSNTNWLTRHLWTIGYAIFDLLSNPGYAIPFLLNVTGSIWFFLLIGQAELSLTVPITNSLAFLFVVLGDWWAESKTISLDTWFGIALVLGGITLCIHAKSE